MTRFPLTLILFTAVSTYGADQGCTEGDCNNGTGIFLSIEPTNLQGFIKEFWINSKVGSHGHTQVYTLVHTC